MHRQSLNAKRNIVTGFINKSVTLMLSFVVRIVLTHQIGAVFLGLDSFYVSIMHVLNIIEMGFSEAVMASMYKPIANNDIVTLCGIYAYYRKAYNRIGWIVLLIGIGLSPFLPFLIRKDMPFDSTILVIYYIHIISTALTYFTYACKQTILSAYQRQDIVNGITALGQGVVYIVQIIVLYMTRNYLLYTLSLLLSIAILYIGINSSVEKIIPQIKCKGNISDDLRRVIERRIKGLLISRLRGISRNSFDGIFVTAFVGLIAVGVYDNYFLVIRAVIIFASVIKSSLIAIVGTNIATETAERNYLDMKRLMFIYMWMAGVATISMLCLFQPFMTVFFGDNMLSTKSVMVLFCILFYILMMGDIRWLYVEAAGLWWEERYPAVIEAATNLLLNAFLGYLYGVGGIILATILSVFLIDFLWNTNNIFRYYFVTTSSAEYYRLNGLYAVVTLVSALITYRIVSFVMIDGIFGMAKGLVICIVVPNIIYMSVYRKTKIYKESIGWLGRVTGWEKLHVWKVFGC